MMFVLSSMSVSFGDGPAERFCQPEGDNNSGQERQPSHQLNGAGKTHHICRDARNDRPHHVPEITPQSVHTNCRAAPRRRRDIPDSR